MCFLFSPKGEQTIFKTINSVVKGEISSGQWMGCKYKQG